MIAGHLLCLQATKPRQLSPEKLPGFLLAPTKRGYQKNLHKTHEQNRWGASLSLRGARFATPVAQGIPFAADAQNEPVRPGRTRRNQGNPVARFELGMHGMNQTVDKTSFNHGGINAQTVQNRLNGVSGTKGDHIFISLKSLFPQCGLQKGKCLENDRGILHGFSHGVES
jgi:hypothetical protein